MLTTYQKNAIDQLFAELHSGQSPGCMLGIICQGAWAFTEGYGLANLEEETPISAQTVFDTGSVSKQFTAACIALLIERGDVGLEDDLQAFFPQMPDYGHVLQLKHLLYHTSGLKDYLELASLKGLDEHTYYSASFATQLLFNQPDLNFVPGDEERYSNSNYMLLGQVVSLVSGLSLRQFAHENIFAPLGMMHTHFHDNFAEVVPQRAIGYTPNEQQGYDIFTSKIDIVGDGALYTTLADLYHWDQNFYHNQLGNKQPGLLQLMTSPGVLNNGTAFDYGFGLILGQYKSKKTQRHGGAFAGYCAEILRFPAEQTSIICLANLATMAPWTLVEQVADIVWDTRKEERTIAPKIPENTFTPLENLPLPLLEQYVGGYDLGAATPLEILCNEGNLQLKYGAENVLTLLPKSENVFVEPEYNIELCFRKTRQRATDFLVFKTPEQEIIAPKVSIRMPDHTTTFSLYTGDYYCEALRVAYHIFVQDQHLYLSIDFHQAIPLHLTEECFAECSLGAIKFLKTGQSISGFRLDAERSSNLRFKKK